MFPETESLIYIGEHAFYGCPLLTKPKISGMVYVESTAFNEESPAMNEESPAMNEESTAMNEESTAMNEESTAMNEV